MQKKGLVINHRELSQAMAGNGPMGRSPFIPNTDRGPKDDGGQPGIKGIGLVSTSIKPLNYSEKKGGANMGSGVKGRNTQNPFTGNQRPDSMISGGRGGSPENSMMYQNKYNTASERQ